MDVEVSAGSSIQPAGMRHGAEVANCSSVRVRCCSCEGAESKFWFKRKHVLGQCEEETYPSGPVEVGRRAATREAPHKLIRERVAISGKRRHKSVPP